MCCGANRWLCQSLSLAAISEMASEQQRTQETSLSTRGVAHNRGHIGYHGDMPFPVSLSSTPISRSFLLSRSFFLFLLPGMLRLTLAWWRLTTCHRGTGKVSGLPGKRMQYFTLYPIIYIILHIILHDIRYILCESKKKFHIYK